MTFNVMAMFAATVLVQEVAQMAAVLGTASEPKAVAGPSRLETFKLGEIAAAKASQVPVPRRVVAHRIPDMPVQLLAVRLDKAEGVKAKPVKANQKPVRMAKVAVRKRKIISQQPGKMPASVIFAASFQADAGVPARSKRIPPIAENSRDITNRSLGALVAMTN